MTTNSPPSGNPADRHNLRGVMRLVLSKFLQRTDDMLPAKIIAYNKATNMAKVQPLIMVVTTDNQNVNRAQVASVPVYQASGGGFILRFPINPGDFGWIKANDRDISLFMQTGEMSPPNTQRKHTFKDALFIPQAFFDLVTIADEDANNVVLQNYAGTVKIALWADQVKITAPTVLFSSPLSTFAGDVTINGVINVNNDEAESNPCNINGAIAATGDIIAGSGAANISVLDHIHGGVTTGGGNTSGPSG